MNDASLWCKASHNIRKSYKKVTFEGLMRSDQHDANKINKTYNGLRRKVALRWAADDFFSFMIIIGGMASPFQKNLPGFGSEGTHWEICGEPTPG